VLPNGALVVAGGRPALNLWVSSDGFGVTWEEFDIPKVHNGLVPDPTLRFCPQFVDANLSLGWEQSSCYTQLATLSHNTALVCYERQGAASGGTKPPPGACAVKGFSLFCMRFAVSIGKQ
jgi:hypothetical protein